MANRKEKHVSVVRTPGGTAVKPSENYGSDGGAEENKVRHREDAKASGTSHKSRKTTKRVVVVKTPDGTPISQPREPTDEQNSGRELEVSMKDKKKSDGSWPKKWFSEITSLPNKLFPNQKTATQKSTKAKRKRTSTEDPNAVDVGCKPRRNRTRSIDSNDFTPKSILRRMGLSKEKKPETKESKRPKKRSTKQPEEEAPVETKPVRHQKPEPDPNNNPPRRSEEKPKESTVAETLMQSFRTIRRKSQEKFTKVKVFVSRPIREKGMQRLLERIRRRPPRNSTARLHQGDDVFPTQKKHTESTESSSKSSSQKSVMRETGTTTKKKKPTETQKPEIEEPKDESSKIFINGRPFWQQKKKGDEKEMVEEESLTDDELPMNAEVLIEVNSGQRTLKEMPRTKIKLEPYGDLQNLESRDDDFFTPEIIFSNTVRTMINLVDEDTKTTSDNADASKMASPSAGPVQVEVEEPELVYLYDLSKPHIGGFPVDRHPK